MVQVTKSKVKPSGGLVWYLLVAFLFSTAQLSGQQRQAQTGYNFGKPELTGAIGFATSFNTADWLLNVNAGVGDKRNLWTARLFFDFRPYEKVIWTDADNGQRFQYRSKRYLVGLMVDKLFLPLQTSGFAAGFFVEGKAGFSFGDYRGTSNDPPKQFLAVPGGGLAFNWKNGIILKAGAQYYDQPNETIETWRVKVGVTFTP